MSSQPTAGDDTSNVFLAPRPILVSPNSPTPTMASGAGSTIVAPPSPTISELSPEQLSSSVALRGNEPGTGQSSLGLLSPVGHSKHPRKGSVASSSNETEPDTHIPLSPTHSSITHVAHEHKKHKASHEQTRDDTMTAQDPKEEEEGEESGPAALEADDDVDLGPFTFRPNQLAMLLDPKSLDSLEQLGGVDAVLQGLGTNATRGLTLAGTTSAPANETSTSKAGTPRPDASVPGIVLTAPGGEEADLKSKSQQDISRRGAYDASVDERKRVYGTNILPKRDTVTLWQLMWTALKDKVLVLLSIAAVISFALGLFQDLGPAHKPGEPKVDWIEGVAIMVAIAIVVIVGSLNDYQKERQFRALNDKKEERGVKVIRNGQECVVDVKEVVVGDIALLEPGEIVPCDGLFISGHNVKCDESGATGESDAIKKVSYDDCIAHRKEHGEEQAHTDCFIVSGSKVLEGVGSYVVIAVGTKSFNGRIMMALRGDSENTPLQLKLNRLAELIAKIGSAAGLLLFIALMIRFFVQLGTKNPPRNGNEQGIVFANILVIAVTIIVVAVPEGLPLAVTLALAFATKRMTYENLLVRVLGSCETMANASVVCTDKTGTLTQNVMTVVAGSIGVHCKFVRQLQENAARTNAEEEQTDQEQKPVSGSRRHPHDYSVDLTELNNVLSPGIQDLYNEAIAVNSTAFEDKHPESGELIFVGSKTETALLSFAKELDWKSFRKTREAAEIVQMIPFSSQRKAMGVVLRMPNGRYRVYLKGASEILTDKCHRYISVRESRGDIIETKEIDDDAQDNISRTIIFYANQTLRTIAVCYRDLESWPPAGMKHDEQNEVDYEDLAQQLTLIAIAGIEDPLRDGVREAVANCHRAGVTVKMCTGDNVLTARSIALQCGIYTPGGIIMEGPVFRELSDTEMTEVVPRLQVLARSSPEDKKILVEKLKSLGEIVGVTGDGTNDGPALKTANVGFSMGIAGTEVAKEASDIILMDDNFASIVKAIMWGRCVNDAVRKFLQFQISTNITAVIITFVSAVASDEEESVLTAVQLLWINIIMDTFAALALATDPASESLLDRKPDRKTAPLFSVDMYKMILCQSIYQVVVILIFHFLGHTILNLGHSEKSDLVVKTLVFNAFVFAQIFNSINCRRLDKKLNIFEGILRNRFFIVITLIEIGGQVLIVFVGGAAFQVTRIGGREWGISLALGVVSIPLGVLVRLLPNGPFEKVFNWLGLLGKKEVLPTTRPEAEWNEAIDLVRDNLGVFGQLRGARMRSSRFVLKSRKARLRRKDERTKVPSVMAMAPAIMVSSIGAGWAPQSGSLSDPSNSDPSRSAAALWRDKIQIHPDTPADDPARQRFNKPKTSTS